MSPPVFACFDVETTGLDPDRARVIEVAADIADDAARALALASGKVVDQLGGAEPRTVIVRAPKLVNLVS